MKAKYKFFLGNTKFTEAVIVEVELLGMLTYSARHRKQLAMYLDTFVIGRVSDTSSYQPVCQFITRPYSIAGNDENVSCAGLYDQQFSC